MLIYSRHQPVSQAELSLACLCGSGEERRIVRRLEECEADLWAQQRVLAAEKQKINSQVQQLEQDQRELEQCRESLAAEQAEHARQVKGQQAREEAFQQECCQIAGQLQSYRISRSYKLGNLAAAARRQPLKVSKAALLWGLGRYKQQGLGLTTAAGAADPLSGLQNQLEAAAATDSDEEAIAPRGRRQRNALGHVVMFAGVPYDDVGGGQRSAQLTRALLRRMVDVTYLYAFPRVDVATGAPVFPHIDLPGLRHLPISQETPEALFRHLPTGSTCIFELPHPAFLPYLEKARACGVQTVFELIDDWDSSLGAGWYQPETLTQFAAKADRSVGTALPLVERLAREPECEPEYLPNAAEERVFDIYQKHPRPADYPRKYRQTILYFGSLYGDWFAWDYVQAAATSNPRVGFVMIGEPPAKLPHLPENVVFLGAKQNPELPAYLAAADAAMIPFTPGRITQAVSPIKAFEYLFLGKPIISTRMEEIADYPGVRQAATAAEFAQLCGGPFAPPRGLDDFISRQSWNARADAMLPRQKLAASYSVITLIHNNESIIERHLETLLRHTQDQPVEVIVVDNASHDGGPEIVERRFPQVKLVRNPANGCACGRNLGVEHAMGEVLVFFDSDQWFTCGGWLAEADHILHHNAQVGAVGWAAGWFCSSAGYLGGPVVDYLPNRGANVSTAQFGYRTDVAYLGSGGMFVPRRVWNQIEGFDEAYDPTVLEDSDLSFQIRDAGFDLAFRDLTGIRHQPHQTTRSADRHAAYMQLLHRNSEYFRRKWSAYDGWWSEERRAA